MATDGGEGQWAGSSEATMAEPLSRVKTWALGGYLIASFLAQIALLVGFWPIILDGGKWKRTWPCWCPTWSDMNRIRECPIGDDARLIVIMLLSGGAGAMVHALRSFSAHAGAQKLSNGWGWWYVLRPFEGATIALAFYLVFRGGLMNAGGAQQATAEAVSTYGMAGLAVMVGMFSSQAVAKMKELAETLFGKASAVVSETTSVQPRPAVAGVSPSEIKQGSTDATVTVTGTGFTENSKIHVDGAARDTTPKSATELVAKLAPTDSDTVGKELKITVVTPEPGGGESEGTLSVRIVS